MVRLLWGTPIHSTVLPKLSATVSSVWSRAVQVHLDVLQLDGSSQQEAGSDWERSDPGAVATIPEEVSSAWQPRHFGPRGL